MLGNWPNWRNRAISPCGRSRVLTEAVMMSPLFVEADWLEGRNNRGYGPLPIPQERDLQIETLLRAYIFLDPIARQVESSTVTAGQQLTLAAYSERMASLAVRRHAKDLILFGLLALSVDGWRAEWRDNLIILALHYDASKRIGVEPEVMFHETQALLPPAAGKELAAFLRRPEHNKSLEAMRYAAGA